MPSDICTVEALTEVTKIQADVIRELFTLLSQHLSVEELDALPCVQKINLAAAIKAECKI